jgi:hypothetical protein
VAEIKTEISHTQRQREKEREPDNAHANTHAGVRILFFIVLVVHGRGELCVMYYAEADAQWTLVYFDVAVF